MEHVFAEITTPPFVGILQIACTMHKNNRRLFWIGVGWFVNSCVYIGTITCLEADHFRIFPCKRFKFFTLCFIGNLYHRFFLAQFLHEQLCGFVRIRVEDGHPFFIGRNTYFIVSG